VKKKTPKNNFNKFKFLYKFEFGFKKDFLFMLVDFKEVENEK